MNPTMLNAYPVGYSLANDIKYTGRDRPYEYLDRSNGLGTNLLDQSMSMSSSNSMDYKYNSNHLQQDGSCNTTNPQALLTPPQSNDDPPASITNPPSSSFGYPTLPKVPASNANLEYYPPATTSFLPPTFNGATMTQADRRPASLHMAPMSPPYNYGPTFSPYSMNRAAMPEFSQFSAQRNNSYDHPFNRGPRPTTLPGPFSSSLLPFTQPMTQNPQHHADGPPFSEMTLVYPLVNSNGHNLLFDIIANIPKGFFKVDDKWTCYRRNYFSVTCGFTFKSHNLDGRVFLRRHTHGNLEQVNGYALSIAAKTAAPNNESEPRGLVQHTPKRDKATETVPCRQPAGPTPPAGLTGSHSMPQSALFPSPHTGSYMAAGLADYGQVASQATPSTQVTFDRIQFQKATANNGKRRAQQQYFHVVVRLEANIGRAGMDEDWIVVASKESDQMVVRGRSPGHYKDTRRDSQTNMDPDAGPGHHGEGGGMSGYSLHPIGTSHSTGLGSAPSSYRNSHHYGTSFSHSSRRAEVSDSSSSSPGSSVTLSSSPHKGDANQSRFAMGRNTLQGVCFDRMALSPMLAKPDTDQMDYHHSKKRGREEDNVEHYFQSAMDASTYGNPSFDFSATSSQALCASS